MSRSRTAARRRIAMLGASLLIAAGVVAGASPAYAASCRSYQYSYGGNGNCVKYIQILANHKLPYIADYTKIAVDGQFGPKTRAGILRIQKKWGLVRDGIVGPKTWAALCSSGTVAPYAGELFTSTEAAAARKAGC
ncbi:peptidoglycan-binding domain-containing protein [Microbacterium sp.]|uniref:peptidoglycan-binding domain-containing protein n=1 Tax=Microbacterium sp. TaxID=51671 RepID=UPI0039E70E27